MNYCKFSCKRMQDCVWCLEQHWNFSSGLLCYVLSVFCPDKIFIEPNGHASSCWCLFYPHLCKDNLLMWLLSCMSLYRWGNSLSIFYLLGYLSILIEVVGLFGFTKICWSALVTYLESGSKYLVPIPTLWCSSLLWWCSCFLAVGRVTSYRV